MRDTEFRLKNKIRIKNKVEFMWDNIWLGNGQGRKWNIDRLQNTRKRCSESCCGNPRKHHGEKTIQELKSDVSYSDMLAGL